MKASTGIVRYPWVLAAFLVLMAGCRSYPEPPADLRRLPQKPSHYLSARTADHPLVPGSRQEILMKEYDRAYFSPWDRGEPQVTRPQVTAEVEKYTKDPGYGENYRKRTPQWAAAIRANTDLDDYPNTSRRGITVDRSHLRMLPTLRPLFADPNQPGEGYPFDVLQNSSLPANTPVFISHTSRDGAWFYVDSHCSSGWMDSRDVAAVDSEFVREWKSRKRVALVRDRVPVCHPDGGFLFQAGIGSLFPVHGEGADGTRIRVAVADSRRNAVLVPTTLPPDAAVLQPLELTARNIARLADELTGEPYGWGGLYFNRDCSATLKDLFTPFGLWLPRNSTHQASRGGRYEDLSALSLKEKETAVKHRAVPFFTLLWARGHIMLYVGVHEGEILVFHTFWGIRTRDFWGKEGRTVVGQTAITTLDPGKEFPDADPDYAPILPRIEAMTFLGQGD